MKLFLWLSLFSVSALFAQQAPYDVFPEAKAPYYRVRYEPSEQPDKLIYGVNYTAWVPPGVKELRGVIVHQHGCGEGSCKSGLTGAFDLHWQALAKKHACALISPAYEQPDKADCQKWCDPRQGSAEAFLQALRELGKKSGHPELEKVPWALWGHSGGGHWSGGMALLYPERVAAAWLRSGVPPVVATPANLKTYEITDQALQVPIMCNLGTKEGVTDKVGRFAGVWPSNEKFFLEMRRRDALVGIAVDPLTAHECGNQRYLAIRWLDECLKLRLPEKAGEPLKQLDRALAWYAKILDVKAESRAQFKGDLTQAVWLPNETIAKAWMEYVRDTKVTDITPPPKPFGVKKNGMELTWEAEADLESGISHFIIERDGKAIGQIPETAKNPFGRPVFQGLQYSDTPTQPLASMSFVDGSAKAGVNHSYRVITVNTAGLTSDEVPH